ncbi:MAG: hypothetical protein KF729_08445 [Sandaracinaceae bacterium]|nr:hypothetical protein [Sandaracinaceae bacterium]
MQYRSPRLGVVAVVLALAATPTVHAQPSDAVPIDPDGEGHPSRADAPEEVPDLESVDTDGDGIPDLVEMATGTDILDVDTDGDGVPDGEEDANRDGVVDPGERDPRVPGLHHLAALLPEPMVFDLVRPLGARAGEVEVNTLIVTDFLNDRPVVYWAPEVEWAIVDGFAVELELPMVDAELDALKLALQWTAPSPETNFAHGVQVIGEVGLNGWEPELTALYLLGGRVDRVALSGMVGARAHGAADRLDAWHVLVNSMVAVDLHEAVTVALETNVAVGLDETVRLALVPQIHWQVVERFRIQLGAGAVYEAGDWRPQAITRLILE